jgi:hypothetical protein
MIVTLFLLVLLIILLYETRKEYYAPASLYLEKLAELDNAEFKSYDRTKFAHWVDYNNDSCNTRSEVLKRDSLVPVEYEDKTCNIAKGKWDSAYDDGLTITDIHDIVDKDGKKVSNTDIDHMVPLKNAWDTGAYKWSDEERKAFANDMTKGHLVVTSKSSNTSKGASGPEKFLPKKDICDYAADWIAIKHRWNLQVYPEERRKLVEILSNCDKELIDFPLYNKGEYRSVLGSEPEIIKYGISQTENKERKEFIDKYKHRACRPFKTRSVTEANAELRRELATKHNLFGINNWEKLSSKKDETLCDIVGLQEESDQSQIDEVRKQFASQFEEERNNSRYNCDLFRNETYKTKLKDAFKENREIFNNKSDNPQLRTMCNAFGIPL